MQTELSAAEMQQLDSMSIDELMLSFRQSTTSKQSSQFRGVSWNTNRLKWRAKLSSDSGWKSFGYFSDELEAAEAVDKALIRQHGRQAACLPWPFSLRWARSEAQE